MFIDYLTLLLINMTTGLVLLAWFVYAGLPVVDKRLWAPGFALVGLIALLFGIHISATWPLPGPFNMAFGELSVFFGGIFLLAALAMALGWSLMSLAVYAFFAGLASILIGVRILDLRLTQQPALSALGFILTGLAGVGAAPTLRWFAGNRTVRIIAALVILLAAIVWAITGYGAYWMHFASLGKWLPAAMR